MNSAQKKVAFMTLGCKVNTYDSEAMMEIFEGAGYAIVDFNQLADVYVINTCTVTHLGDQKSRKMMRKAKRMNPDAVICAVGCYVQVAPEEVEKITEVDLMIGTKNRGDILTYIDAHLQDVHQRDFVSDIMDEKIFEPLMISEVKGKTRAFIKIQEGCNQFCTYCIVPFARGPVRSRRQDQIIAEVKRVVAIGYQEVILTGIHIASYGVDQAGVDSKDSYDSNDQNRTDLIGLLEALDQIEGLKRIRLGSLEPKYITPERLKRLAALESFCPHFHLSLQSGSDTVLKRMGRRYSTAEYLAIVNEIRAVFPLAAITTDIMVGFPGETEAEFNETLAFAKDVGFYQIHVFKYSRRAGTKAAEFKDQVDETIKNQRSHQLSELSHQLEEAFLKKNDGLTVEVLFEATHDEDGYEGHTKNYVPVSLQTDEKINGRIIEVRVSYSNRYSDKLIGESIYLGGKNMSKDCIFCKIVNKEIPADIVFEDDLVIAFNDIAPQAPVHVIIIPKEHFDSLLSVPAGNDIICHMHTVANRIALKVGIAKTGFRLVNNCGKDGNQTVPHLHYHLLGGRPLLWPPG